MKPNRNVLWAEKYRPTSLDEYVFHDQTHKKAFNQMVKNQTIPHLLLSGVQGSGKTTVAQILIDALDVDTTDLLIVNGSDETGVDAMRDKIKAFISTYAINGLKIVLLEECDYLSPNAQAVLRKYMEDFNDDARFILTCNYENKIMPAIKSRSQQYRFKSGSQDDIAEFVAKILLAEKIKFDVDLLYQYISVGYPDIRKIINLLQQNSIDGVLQPLLTVAEAGDYKFKLLDMINIDDWKAARKIVCENVAAEEWEDLYRFLYDNLDKSKKFSNEDKWEAGIVVITDYLSKNTTMADPEMNAAAMFIKLSQI